jgi:hypothetical protein
LGSRSYCYARNDVWCWCHWWYERLWSPLMYAWHWKCLESCRMSITWTNLLWLSICHGRLFWSLGMFWYWNDCLNSFWWKWSQLRWLTWWNWRNWRNVI